MSTVLVPQLLLPILCEHLRSLGFEADLVPEVKKRAFFPGSDVGYLALKDSPIDLLSVTEPGLSSLRLSNWSHTTKIGRLPVSARKVVPIELHFILKFGGLLSRDVFKARFRGAGEHPSWRGGRLAELLSTDAPLAEALSASLGTHDRLSVLADPRHFFVRIAVETSLRAGFALLPRPKLELESGLPSQALIEALARVAGHVKAFL